MSNNYCEIFPENLKKYKNLQAISKKFSEVLKKNIANNTELLGYFINLEKLPNLILDELAWGFDIEDYKSYFNRERKIILIKSAYWAYAKKGTKFAVCEALRNSGYSINLKEWFEYEGNPYTFKIELDEFQKNNEWLSDVVKIVNKNKNTRSILESTHIISDKKYSYFIKAYKQVFINTEI